MNGDVTAIRPVLAWRRYTSLVWPAVFLAELALCGWISTAGPLGFLRVMVAGGLAGLVPSVINAVALWLGHSGLREPVRADRLAAAVRLDTIAFWIGYVGCVVPLAVGFLLAFGRLGGLYLIFSLAYAVPNLMSAASTRTSRRQLILARNAVSQPNTGVPSG
jgi:hypothetical protein